MYVRRDALELVGALDEQLDLRAAIELDFAQRCLLSGLTHVAADDVVVERARAAEPAPATRELAAELRERYPYLADDAARRTPACSAHALQSARAPAQRGCR